MKTSTATKTIAHWGAAYRLQFRGERGAVMREVNTAFNYGIITCPADRLMESETPDEGIIVVDATSNPRAFHAGLHAMAHNATREVMATERALPSVWRAKRQQIHEALAASYVRVPCPRSNEG